MHNGTRWIGVAVATGLWLGCGDDDSSATSKNTTGGSSARAGTGGTTATGTAGAPSLTDLINMFTAPMCNESATSETSCGDMTCPELPSNAEMSCTINCCTADETCGTRSADLRIEQFLGSTCLAPVEPDDRCPSVTILGNTLPGCCDAAGNCGQSVGGSVCIAAPGAQRCDGTGNDAGVSDAGN